MPLPKRSMDSANELKEYLARGLGHATLGEVAGVASTKWREWAARAALGAVREAGHVQSRNMRKAYTHLRDPFFAAMQGWRMEMAKDTFGLAEILAPRSIDEFLERFWGKKFAFSGGQRERFCKLFSWATLNHVVRGDDAGARLRLYKNGKAVPRETFTCPAERDGLSKRASMLSLADLTAQLRGGAILIVQELQESSDAIRRLAAELEWTLRECVMVEASAAWRMSKGFAAQWEDHDTFILQIAGRMKWNVYSDGRPHPIRPDAHRPPEKPVWSGTVEEGNVLYIPRGWWREASSPDEPCLHLTVGVQNRTGLTYLEWLTRRLAASELFRRDLPRFADPEARREHFARLRHELFAAWGPNMDVEYFRSLDAARAARLEPCFPWRAMEEALPEDDECFVTLDARRPLDLAGWSDDDGKALRLSAAGRSWRFSASARHLVEELSAGESVRISALCARAKGTMSREQVRSLLQKLVVAGIVSVGEAARGPGSRR